ncbi:Rmf/CrpP fold protein [Streptomyces sp. NPDC059649]|uniref:Rmf/CrpP fold protein n=1 Tax=unclassified Streptomyces TaxID=2593676 RepID=UPI0036C3E53B
MSVNVRESVVRAQEAGRAAGRSAAPVTSCPYPRGDLRRAAWVRGYSKARPLPDESDD